MIESLKDLAADLRSIPGPIPPIAHLPANPGFPELPDVGPLPCDFLSRRAQDAARRIAALREGCYLAVWAPPATAVSSLAWPACIGTLRWERLSAIRGIASVDLYRSDPFREPAASLLSRWTRSETHDRVIPVFPRDRYFAYLTLGGVHLPPSDGDASDDGIVQVEDLCLGGRIHRLHAGTGVAWEPPEAFVLQAGVITYDDEGAGVAARFSARDRYARIVGELHLRWISSFHREASIEVDAETGLAAPLESGIGDTWASIFAHAGWRVRIESGTIESKTPSSGRWNYADLHAALVASRENSDLDVDWRYHVSAVRRFAETYAPLGIAFDHEGMDLNGIPREGVAVNAHARLPAERAYGPYAGQRLVDRPDLYLFVAAHEIGHAMGLYHNTETLGIMTPLDVLAAHAPGGALGPDSLFPRFAAEDIFRLRHLPDVQVRPGGLDFETLGVVEEDAMIGEARHAHHRHGPIADDSASNAFHLELSIAQSELPIGAPIRLDLALRNRGRMSRDVPMRLGLDGPFVRGWVVDPEGTENPFSSLFRAAWPATFTRLEAGQVHTGSMTLLRGRRGALLQRPGQHTVWIEIAWTLDGRQSCVRQQARVLVQVPRNNIELRVGRALLRTPQTLGILALGKSSAFSTGERAIDLALQSDSFRPHFAYIKAKTIAATAMSDDERENLRQLLDPEPHRSILNRRELNKACQLLRGLAPTSPPTP